MATTLQNLIDAVQIDLGEDAKWTETYITQWCRDAIADYSTHIPRTRTSTISTSANDRTYDLPADFIRPILIEYPTGDDPPSYLSPRPVNHPNFWSEDGYYTIISRRDDTDVSELWISEKPAASETITITYKAHHDNTILAAGNLTVPDEHLYILRNYTIWRATLQLKFLEEATPSSSSSLIMSQLAQAADRLQKQYLNSIAKLLFEEQNSTIISWADQTPETTRIY